MPDADPILDELTSAQAIPAPPPAPPSPSPRIPNLGHALLFGVLLCAGLMTSAILMLVSMHYRLFGIGTIDQAMHSLAFNLGAMLVVYLIAFGPAAAAFPVLWRRGFLGGLQWNASTARHLWPWLFSCGAACFAIAFACRSFLHFPENTPMQGLLRAPGDMWLMLAFAVTLAPLCEEIIFRGFLLPAFCTAADWAGEKLTGRAPRSLGPNGHPQWSLAAMIFGSIVASVLFALYHSFQNANALGPAILIFAVSLILCAVRLLTRSLAASTLTHATYNFTLFVFTFFTTAGFTHLHK